MKEKKIKGLWTALVTPFKEGNGIDNEIDYKALEDLLQMQINGKVDGVLLLGTTAETPTLTKDEGLKLVKFAIEKLRGKTKIMVNAGTYSTKKTLENISIFDKIDGIDFYLIVNPYYNKPTQTGLFEHFTTVAENTNKQVILYNIEGRTGVNLETKTLLEILEKCPNIVGIKEASGNMAQMKEVINLTKENFSVLSGDDGLTSQLIANSGDGIVSVASNCIPGEIKKFVDICFNSPEKAEEKNKYYAEFFKKLFIQTNPLPAKTFLASRGIIKEEFRLPICKMDKKEKKEFLEIVEKYGF